MTKQNKQRAILAAILAIIIAVCTAALTLIDNNPETKPDVVGTVQEVQEQIETIKELRNPEVAVEVQEDEDEE